MLLNKFNLKLSSFCSKDEGRPMLGFLYVDKEKCVATDGHRVIRVNNPKLPDDEFPKVPLDPGFVPALAHCYLSPSACRDAEKAFPKKTTLPILNHALVVQNGTMAGLVTTDLDNVKKSICRQPEETEAYNPFVTVNKILDDTLKNLPTVKVDFDAGLLIDTLTYLSGLSANRVLSRITLEFRKAGLHAESGGTLVLKAKNGDTGQEAVALVLPLRTDGQKLD